MVGMRGAGATGSSPQSHRMRHMRRDYSHPLVGCRDGGTAGHCGHERQLGQTHQPADPAAHGRRRGRRPLRQRDPDREGRAGVRRLPLQARRRLRRADAQRHRAAGRAWRPTRSTAAGSATPATVSASRSRRTRASCASSTAATRASGRRRSTRSTPRSRWPETGARVLVPLRVQAAREPGRAVPHGAALWNRARAPEVRLRLVPELHLRLLLGVQRSGGAGRRRARRPSRRLHLRGSRPGRRPPHARACRHA